MAFILKSKQFETALREYQAATKKDMAEVLNRALRNVGFRAAQFTPKKDAGMIEEELRKEQIGLKFITKKLRAKIGSSYTTEKGNVRTIRRVTRKQIALKTRQFIARRKKRTGFLRAGWVAALINAGLKTTGLSGALIKDSKSTLGSGNKATPKRLVARLGNAVWGRLTGKSAGKMRAVMQRSLQRAMDFVANDMKKYASDLLQKSAVKHSAKH